MNTSILNKYVYRHRMHKILIPSGGISIFLFEHVHAVHISMNGHEIVYETRKNKYVKTLYLWGSGFM